MYMFIYGNERNNQSWCQLIDRLSKFQLTRRCSHLTAANLGFVDGTTLAVSAAADLPMWRDDTASDFKDLRPGLNPILTAILFGTMKSDSMKCCEHTCLFAVLPSAVLSPARNFCHSSSCRLIRLIHSRRTCGSSGNLWNDPSNLGLSFLSLVRFEQPTTTQYTILLSVSNREALDPWKYHDTLGQCCVNRWMNEWCQVCLGLEWRHATKNRRNFPKTEWGFQQREKHYNMLTFRYL